jgi:hypothetical protein
VPDFGVSTRGNFEPLVNEKVFFRVQAILDGRLNVTDPRQRNDPDFPLRAARSVRGRRDAANGELVERTQQLIIQSVASQRRDRNLT